MRVGIVGDIHAPFTHPLYLDFIQDTFTAWDVDHVHFAGDIVDAHAISFWDHDPDGMSAGDEKARAAEAVQSWCKVFPEATVSIGNHDERHFRVAKKAGIPSSYLKGYKEVWRTPDWDWDMSHVHDGVLYEHGTGTSGKDGAINRAINKRCSLVMGHIHAWASVKYHTSDFSRIFGMNVGWGGDCKAYAFSYGSTFAIRPVLSCGIVIDGVAAYVEPMPCGPGETYHRGRK